MKRAFADLAENRTFETSAPKRRRKGAPMKMSDLLNKKRNRDLARIALTMPPDHPALHIRDDAPCLLESMPNEILQHLVSFLWRADCYSMTRMNHRLRLIALASVLRDHRVIVESVQEMGTLVSVYSVLPMVGLYTRALYLRCSSPEILDIPSVASFFDKFDFVVVLDLLCKSNYHALQDYIADRPLERRGITLNYKSPRLPLRRFFGGLETICKKPVYLTGDAFLKTSRDACNVCLKVEAGRVYYVDRVYSCSNIMPAITAEMDWSGVYSNFVCRTPHANQPTVYYSLRIQIPIDTRNISSPLDDTHFIDMVRNLRTAYTSSAGCIYVHKVVVEPTPLEPCYNDMWVLEIEPHLTIICDAINDTGILQDKYGVQDVLGQTMNCCGELAGHNHSRVFVDVVMCASRVVFFNTLIPMRMDGDVVHADHQKICDVVAEFSRNH